MARRTLITKRDIPALKIWLGSKGFKQEKTKGEYEYFRARKGKKIIIFYFRDNGLRDSLTVTKEFEGMITNYVTQREVWQKIFREVLGNIHENPEQLEGKE
jgi:hypothetical protein